MLPSRWGKASEESAARGEKPILACFMGSQDVMPGRDELVASNLPDYTSPERAMQKVIQKTPFKVTSEPNQDVYSFRIEFA